MSSGLSAYLELRELVDSRKITLTAEEGRVLSKWQQHSVKGFFLGFIGGSTASWLVTGVVHNLCRFGGVHNMVRLGFAAATGWLAGQWGWVQGLDSGAELVLSQHGTRLQKELGKIMLKQYQRNPPVLPHVSKYFYPENVYDDDSTDLPKLRWCFRSSFGEVSNFQNMDGDASSSKKPHSGNTDLRKTTLERKQIQRNGDAAGTAPLGSIEDPFDCILGYQGSTEEIPHPAAPSTPPRRRSHSRKWSHGRRWMHRPENIDG